MPHFRSLLARALTLALAAGLAVTGLALGAAPAGAAVLTVPPTLASDCSVDVTPGLQAWIDAAPNGSTLQFAPGACYRIDNTVVVRDRVGLTFDGPGATFRQVTDGSELGVAAKIRARAAWLFVRGSGNTMRGVTVIGANPAAGLGDPAYQPRFEGQAAYWIQGSTNTLLDGVQAYDTYGDFVYVAPGTDGLLVRNSTFFRNGRQGWTINGSNITFDHNTIGDTRRATIDMEPTYADWSAHNITISNNLVRRGRGYFVANKGVARARIDGVTIADNTLMGHTLQIMVVGAIGSDTRRNYKIIGNRSNMNISGYGASIALRNAVGVEVRDNVQPTQNSHPLRGVTMKATSHVVITGNRWDNAKGVWLDRGQNVDVRQSNNLIGRPVFLAGPTVTAGPTPLLAR